MSAFSAGARDFWNRMLVSGETLHSDPSFLLTVNPALRTALRVVLLKTLDGRTMTAVVPELATRLELQGKPVSSLAAFRQRLSEAGVALYGADQVFYFTDADHASLLSEQSGGSRRLSEEDRAAFADFEACAPSQDLEAAYVALDHWAVFGAFEQSRLVSIASAYPWGGERIADLGVLTLQAFRGRGHARELVRSISRYAIDQGHEPQYRCQIDNQVSLAVARSAGLSLFGELEVASPSPSDAV